MTPSRLKAIEERFHAALPLGEAERVALLASLDAELRAEVEALLRAHANAPEYIIAEAPLLRPAQGNEPAEGLRLGPYRLVREIGSGGMGAVWLAERDDALFEKRVAIKLLPDDSPDRADRIRSETARRRFREERQILARLEHPNIARLLDGGETPDGSPWFAMEYVEGEPIDRYCARCRLSIAERLALFRTVCGAIHYAHQNLVLHRDLKPGNIFVTADGIPKLLDFGVASMLLPQEPAATTTIPERLTPGYASPEQLRGQSLTTASDVYNLGVVLYELLTGHRPYHVGGLAMPEILRIVCNETPVRPSQVVRRTGAAWREIAGDLDEIVMTAIRKDPRERYPSADQLAADLQRHLTDRPVTVRPDTSAYRARKLLRRNRGKALAAALILVSLATGTVATFHQASAARQERDASRRTLEFLRDTLSTANPAPAAPGHRLGSNVNLLDVVREAEARLDTEFANQPAIRAELRYTIGQIWKERGELHSAEANFKAAREILLGLRQERHPTAVLSLYHLGYLEGLKGRHREAIAMVREAVSLMRQVDPNHADFPQMLLGLSQRISQKPMFAEAEALILEARDAARRITGSETHFKVAYTFCRMGNLALRRGDLAGAEANYREYLTRLQALPVRHEAGEALYNLGLIAYTRGEDRIAEASLLEAERLYSLYLGPAYPQIAEFLHYLAEVHLRQGEIGRAEAEARRALAINRQAWSETHIRTLNALALLSKVLLRAEKTEEGLACLQEARKKLEAAPDQQRSFWLHAAGLVGETLARLNRYDETGGYLHRSLEGFRASREENSPEILEARARLAAFDEARRRAGGAAPDPHGAK